MFGLLKVSFSVDTPPTGMVDGVKLLAIVAVVGSMMLPMRAPNPKSAL